MGPNVGEIWSFRLGKIAALSPDSWIKRTSSSADSGKRRTFVTSKNRLPHRQGCVTTLGCHSAKVWIRSVVVGKATRTPTKRLNGKTEEKRTTDRT